MRRGLAAALALAAAGLVAPPASAHQGHVEELDTARPEAWAMRWFAAELLDSGTGEPEALAPGSVELGVEAIWLPTLSERQRTVGFDGTKEEDLNRTPVAVRPTVRLGLPGGLVATAGWVPPIELEGAKADVLTLALGRSFRLGARTRLALRVAAAHGSVRGDFTCPADAAAAGDDPGRNPYGCDAASRDEQSFDTLGLEGLAAWRLGEAPTSPELRVGLGAHRFDGEFQVDALYNGFRDQGHLANESSITTVSAGLAMPAGERTRLAFEALWAPLEVDRRTGADFARQRERDDLFHLRATVSVRLR